MILCIDIGNSHLYGGVFDGDQLILRFRQNTKTSTSDEIGIFLKSVLRENDINHNKIEKIIICSVVPHLEYSLKAACIKYLNIEPSMLTIEGNLGLNIQYTNPIEVGADRLANALAITHLYPKQNVIIIDFGTAITFCALSADKTYHGGVIMPGIRLSMEALHEKTAKLPLVEIMQPDACLGRSTIESIQSGIFYSTLGGCREIVTQLKKQLYDNKEVLVVGTGGFATLFEQYNIFDINLPDLVLQGLLYFSA